MEVINYESENHLNAVISTFINRLKVFFKLVFYCLLQMKKRRTSWLQSGDKRIYA